MGLKTDISHSPTQGIMLGSLSAKQASVKANMDGMPWKQPKDPILAGLGGALWVRGRGSLAWTP